MRHAQRIWFTAFALCLAQSVLYAGDTIYVGGVTHQYADTFRLQDQPSAVEDETVLWQLLARQSRELQVRDSLQRDSLLTDLLQRDSLLQASVEEQRRRLREQEGVLAAMRDSIQFLQQAQHIVTKDSAAANEPLLAQTEIDSLQLEMDSIASQLAHTVHINRAVIEPSIFKDVAEDLADVARALRAQQSGWLSEADVMLQFTQNYISPNWYKGGMGNFAILSLLKGTANYNKGKISWENLGEWRTGVTTTPGDTLRKFNVTDDLFRIYSKFGYRIANKLYGSASLEFNTTLWNVWNANKSTAKTAFMTPAKFYVNAGIDYRPVKDLSIEFAPATYKLVYAHFAGDSIHNINVTDYGIKAGENLLHEFGSTLRVRWKYKPVREFALDTEFYFYTNYRSVEIDWEINADFIINRFLTTRLTLHPRYDSAFIREGDKVAHLQFKELLSIGFAHKFR